MAISYSHKFGQIIGDLLELAIEPHLRKFAKQNTLYLDKKGARKTRKGKKLSWIDSQQNSHDLDFVLERGGTNSKLGTPVAFIETAWRRYTRHSRNKAQEIQGAILPLAEKFKNASPFKGVVLAGIFTKGSLSQLKSNGFTVLYFPYNTVIKAFRKFGINAECDEDTSEEEFKNKIESWDRLENKNALAKELLRLNKKEVNQFLGVLLNTISRYIVRIIVVPLHGAESNLTDVNDAIVFIRDYNENNQSFSIAKYEISIRYNNGDQIDASFKDKMNAIRFLESYQ